MMNRRMANGKRRANSFKSNREWRNVLFPMTVIVLLVAEYACFLGGARGGMLLSAMTVVCGTGVFVACGYRYAIRVAKLVKVGVSGGPVPSREVVGTETGGRRQFGF